MLSLADRSDDLHALPFLEKFTREILRIDSPVPLVGRESAAKQTLPLSRPVVGRDGTLMESVVVDKGMEVVICEYQLYQGERKCAVESQVT